MDWTPGCYGRIHPKTRTHREKHQAEAKTRSINMSPCCLLVKIRNCWRGIQDTAVTAYLPKPQAAKLLIT